MKDNFTRLPFSFQTEKEMIDTFEQLRDEVLWNIHRSYETTPKNHKLLDTLWLAYESLCKSVLQLKHESGAAILKDMKE